MTNFRCFFSTGVPDEILYSSLLILVLVLACGLLCKRVEEKKRFIIGAILIEYLFIVACSTVICRGVQSFQFARLELTPFWTYWAVVKHIPGVSVWDILLNVVLFVPLGFLVKLLSPSIPIFRMLVIAVLCSLFIETNQYIFEKGVAQFDDVMHNTIGAVIGWGIARVIMNLNIILQK